jgi:N6-adenosine-specific RNA methylase IME4
MNLKINPEYEALLPKLSKEEYEALKESIKREGQHYPIIVNVDLEVLDGHHRLKACQELAFEPAFETRKFESKLLEKKFVIESNLRRRNLNDFQKAEMGMVLLEVEKELAKERMKVTPNDGTSIGTAVEKTAQKIGLSEKTFERAKKVIEKGSEELKKKVREGKISVNAAHVQVRRAEKHIETPKLPDGEFDVIYADPPWKYDFCLEGNPQEQYAEMDTAKICELPVPTAKDAILFLWATNPKIEDALKVVKAWGFKYITNLVWVKQTLGLGYYSMAQHELLLICKRGEIPPPQAENRPHSVIQAERTNHSHKPEVFYDIIEKMYPNRKYLELFSRNQREKWIMWGNEANGKSESSV